MVFTTTFQLARMSMRVFGLLSFTDPLEHLLNCKRLLLLLNVYSGQCAQLQLASKKVIFQINIIGLKIPADGRKTSHA